MRDCMLKRRLVIAYETIYALAHNQLPIVYLRLFYRLPIMNTRRTIRYIRKSGCAVSRFGDGEMNIILGDSDISFQKQDDDLQARLKTVIISEDERLLLCLPRFLNSFKGCTAKSHDYWSAWALNNKKQKRFISWIKKAGKRIYLFGDTQFTRPYMDTQNKKYAKQVFLDLKTLWENRPLLIVEGTQTRLGVGNDLFDNARSIKRILAPAINAFDSYEQILYKVIFFHSDELVLIALGPTATVLAADLSKRGIQAIDIGHIDIEYEWFLRGATRKVAIEGKYTNEAADGRKVVTCSDKQYLSQIVSRIE